MALGPRMSAKNATWPLLLISAGWFALPGRMCRCGCAVALKRNLDGCVAVCFRNIRTRKGRLVMKRGMLPVLFTWPGGYSEGFGSPARRWLAAREDYGGGIAQVFLEKCVTAGRAYRIAFGTTPTCISNRKEDAVAKARETRARRIAIDHEFRGRAG